MSHVGSVCTTIVVHGRSTGKLLTIHPHGGGGGEGAGVKVTGYDMVKRLRKGRVLDPVDPWSHVLLEGLGFVEAVGAQSHPLTLPSVTISNSENGTMCAAHAGQSALP